MTKRSKATGSQSDALTIADFMIGTAILEFLAQIDSSACALYLLTNFLTSPRKSAPYTLPWESVVTPSAILEPPAYGYGHGSGMKYLTEPSLAFPILMPRWAPKL